ncbi:DUF2971 domain-containing protein [Povalibacter sp.]|uniref:DUF2971 domain-containing protein n=1 Tax=Povalibacter sp. TaxID=1962978 RepID=UPI002F41F214
MRVYHLLSSQNALSDISLKRLRISRYGDLNDPFELFAGNLGDKRYRQAVRSWKDEFNKTKGLMCFSKKWENPVLWSHYGAKHRGICLGFDINDSFAIPIEYSDQRLPVEFENDDPSKGIKEDYVRRLVCTKFEHWRYEDEVRLIVGLDEGTVEDGSYFYPFSQELELREVVLGPLCQIPIEAVRSLVASIYQGVVVRKARLAFKWFTVVPDERFENGRSREDA